MTGQLHCKTAHKFKCSIWSIDWLTVFKYIVMIGIITQLRLEGHRDDVRFHIHCVENEYISNIADGESAGIIYITKLMD